MNGSGKSMLSWNRSARDVNAEAALDIECLDRIYLNAYVPVLQTSSQVMAFLSGHLGFPFPRRSCSGRWATGSAGQWSPSPMPITSRGSSSVRTSPILQLLFLGQ